MDQSGNLLIKLEDLSQFLARENLSDNLDALAALTARLVGAQTCSILLVKDGAEHDLRMRVCASVGAGDGIAGQVMASGRSMLVEDIQDSPVAHLARHADEAGFRVYRLQAPIGAGTPPADVAADLSLIHI